MNAVLSTAGGLVAVLNEHRQLLSLNHAYLDFLGIEEPHAVLGLRPGEAVLCPHAESAPGGCGTGVACRTCGAAIAILAASQSGEPVEDECVVPSQRREDDLVLRVRAAPVRMCERTFTLFFLNDISEQRRREALDRTFLHDMNNVVQALVGTSDLLSEAVDGQDRELLDNLRALALRVSSEIASQRALLYGERFRALEEPVEVAGLLEEVQRTVVRHPAARGRRVASLPPPGDIDIRTDRHLVERILTNMVINALEASPEGAVVTMHARHAEDAIDLAVHNPGMIPDEARPRVFQRFFTTKRGIGRGHGTYSMKLFGEQVLGGRVSFSTDVLEGTEFVMRLPRSARS